MILTQGDRPVALSAAVESVSFQQRAELECVVVGNGAAPGEIAGARSVVTDTNVGIPAGRNLGAETSDAPFILFLDDDAHLLHDDLVARALSLFDADPKLGVVALRIVDPEGHTSARHVPRLGGRSAARSGPVTAFLGGACVVRREAWESVGGYEGDFFYAMEETDVSWRLIDQGWSIHYAADLTVEHPRTEPARHGDAVFRTARNRTWAARRNLPALLVPVYLGVWALLGTVRAVRRGELPRELLAGYRAGRRTLPGGRRPMRWRTVARLTRLGRPPVI